MTFLLDTSILNQLKNVETFAELCATNGHRIQIPAIVHAERLYQLRREFGDRFDESQIRAWFERFEPVISVGTLDPGLAEQVAQRLHGRIPSDAEGRRMKDDGHAIDAHIAATADPLLPIVTADRGPAWKACPPGTVLSLNEATALAGSS